MERMYTSVVSSVASPATAAFDLFEIVAGTNKPIAIQRLLITQTTEATTEEEQVPISFIRGFTTSGSGGSSSTPAPVSSNDGASAATVETMNTTVATTGTTTTHLETAFNTRPGLDLPFAPEEQFQINPAERMVIRIGAHADAITLQATLWFKELV